MRRLRTALLAAGAALAAVAVFAPATTALAGPGQPGRPSSNTGRAESALAALTTYLSAGNGLYHEQYPAQPTDNPYSYEWPFSQAHIAIADLVTAPGGQRVREQLRRAEQAQEDYWKADGGTTGLPGYASGILAPFGTGGDFFYDDNEWVGLLDVQRYLTSHDIAALHRAEQIFALVRSGWDTDASHADAGGTFWTQASWSSDRNTVSNMPAAELGLRLYQITHQRGYLDWSMKLYDWTNRYLQRPDGLYNDHVSLDGTVETTIWSYNQGVPVGVNTLLYQITRQRKYLVEAERIANAALSYYAGTLDQQPAYFNSIFFKNLLLLESSTGGHRYRDAAQAWADHAWSHDRDPATGLFHFGGSSETQTLEQAAMVQTFAVLAWSPHQLRNLY